MEPSEIGGVPLQWMFFSFCLLAGRYGFIHWFLIDGWIVKSLGFMVASHIHNYCFGLFPNFFICNLPLVLCAFLLFSPYLCLSFHKDVSIRWSCIEWWGIWKSNVICMSHFPWPLSITYASKCLRRTIVKGLY